MAADTFGLLSVSCGNLQQLTPFHFLALLDPKAQWFRKWMVRVLLIVYVCMVIIQPCHFNDQENKYFQYTNYPSVTCVYTIDDQILT